MRKIKLYNSQHETIIDEADFALVSQFVWKYTKHAGRNNEYAYTQHKGKTLLLHRLLLKPARWAQVDHIDRNGLNNQRNNLRIVSYSKNQFNANKRKGTISKYRGVTPYRDTGKWIAKIKILGKSKHLGIFDSEEQAHQEYLKHVPQ